MYQVDQHHQIVLEVEALQDLVEVHPQQNHQESNLMICKNENVKYLTL